MYPKCQEDNEDRSQNRLLLASGAMHGLDDWMIGLSYIDGV